MDAQQYIELKENIACGKFECLQNCCRNMSDLRAVWVLMNTVSESDLIHVQVMLCGCAVSRPLVNEVNPNAPGPSQSNPSGATPIACSEAVTKWACDPTHKVLLTALSVGLGAASIIAVRYPPVGIVVGALSLIVDDLTAGCDEMARTGKMEYTWTDSLIDKLCGVTSWLESVKQRAPTSMGQIITLIDQAQSGLNFLSASGGVCCVNRRVSNPFPDLAQIPLEVPTTPSTTIPTVPTLPNPGSTVLTFGPAIPPPVQVGSSGSGDYYYKYTY